MARKRDLKRPERTAGALRLLAFAIGAIGAGGAVAQTVTITPSVQTRLTWTDNAPASSSKTSDWIAELTPSIDVSRKSGRVNGQLGAQLRNIGYASETDRNTTFLALQGRGEIEAVENLLFVDLDANISRNNLSAFTGRSSNDELSVDEGSETRSWSIGPRLQFNIGQTTQGSVRYLSRWLESGGATIGNQRLDQWTAQLSSPAATRVVGWGLDFTRSESEYERNANRIQQTGRATLFVNVNPQFRLRAIGGQESNNFGVAGTESGAIYGGGVDWNPTERTDISATVENRIFGTGYDIRFNHRAARSSWNLSYERGFLSSLQTFSNGDQLARAEATCQALWGIDAVPPAGPLLDEYDRCLDSFDINRRSPRGTLSDAQFLSKSIRAGFTLIGVRNTLTFSAQKSDRSRLGSLAGLSDEDDFAQSETVKTTSLTVSLNHKISGTSSLTSALTQSRSEGDAVSNLDTKRLSASVGLSTTLGPRTNAGLTYRYQRADGRNTASDFTENALTANLGMTF